MSIFVISDLHLGHNRPFVYEARGYTSIEEHDTELISNWNSIVKSDDTVYVLGDIVMKHDADDNDFEYGISLLKQLNGKLHIIQGNHDSAAKLERYRQCPNVVSAGLAAEHLYYPGIARYHFYLTHAYTRWSRQLKPMKTAIITLYGHTHQKEKFYTDSEFINGHPYEYCVCLDAHNMYPVLLDDIIEQIKAKRAEYP